jgi:hypothetical protein
MQDSVKKLGMSIPVGTGESYPDWLAASDELWKAVDKVIWHVHPWWEQKNNATAGAYAQTVKNQMAARLAKVGNKPMVLGETGWPTGATTGQAVGSPANQATYFKDLHAWAWQQGFEYWSFTAFDEKWKTGEGAVGGVWGMWNSDRTPKIMINQLSTVFPAYSRWENPAPNGTPIVTPDRMTSRQMATKSLLHKRGQVLQVERNALGRKVLILKP